MPTLPAVIVTLLLPFEHLFDRRTWRKARTPGSGSDPVSRQAHSVLRAEHPGDWSARRLRHLSPGAQPGPLAAWVRPTSRWCLASTRRWNDGGPKIAAKGKYRDPVRSTDDQVVMTPGLQWVSLMLLTRIGWAGRHWALPFLTALGLP